MRSTRVTDSWLRMPSLPQPANPRGSDSSDRAPKRFGLASKIEARKIAERAGVPVIPSEGFPLLVKAAAGGGGKGMRRVDRAEDLQDAMLASAREAESAFGDSSLLVERYLERARHI